MFDLLLENSDGSSFTYLDPENEGVHYARARVDTFYKAILVPVDLFPKFVTFVDTQFNKTEGPAKGKIMCDDKEGFCYVYGMTCSEARPQFRTFYFEMNDNRAFAVKSENYLED